MSALPFHPQPKIGPSWATKQRTRRDRSAAEQRAKKQLRAASSRICPVCKVHPVESVHEVVPKSRGGKPEAPNQLPVCGLDNAHGCHGALHQRLVTAYRKADGSWSFTLGRDVVWDTVTRRFVRRTRG